jgi:hypothetical protein
MTVETQLPARCGQLQHMEQKIIKQAKKQQQTKTKWRKKDLITG